MTRALKNAVMQQQVFSVDKALQILHQETPLLVVDKDKLKVCLFDERRVFSKLARLHRVLWFCFVFLHLDFAHSVLVRFCLHMECLLKLGQNVVKTDIF